MTTSLNPETNKEVYEKFKAKETEYKKKTEKLRDMMNNVLKKRDDLIKKNPGCDKIVEIQSEFNRLDKVLQKLEAYEDLTSDELTLFTGGKRRKSRRNRKSKKNRKSRNNRRKSKRRSRR